MNGGSSPVVDGQCWAANGQVVVVLAQAGFRDLFVGVGQNTGDANEEQAGDDHRQWNTQATQHCLKWRQL